MLICCRRNLFFKEMLSGFRESFFRLAVGELLFDDKCEKRSVELEEDLSFY